MGPKVHPSLALAVGFLPLVLVYVYECFACRYVYICITDMPGADGGRRGVKSSEIGVAAG